MQVTEYQIKADSKENILIALVADLHDRPADDVLSELKKRRPDLIAVCGDVLNAHAPGASIYDDVPGAGRHLRDSAYAAAFLQEASRLAPTFFSTGNHELYFDEEDAAQLRALKITFLDNGFTEFRDLVIGGLSSPYPILAGTGLAQNKEESSRRWEMIFENVNRTWLDQFEKQSGYKILLCHHPELYDRYIKQHKKIDLILSGHTHGGQIRIFGRGLFAHGQGWFPKYSGGFYDGKLIVSRGLSNTAKIPRIFNREELVFIRL